MAKKQPASKAHKKVRSYSVEAEGHRRKARKNLTIGLSLIAAIVVLVIIDLHMTNMGYMRSGFVDFNLFVLLGLFLLIFIAYRYIDLYFKERKALKKCRLLEDYYSHMSQ